MKENNYSKIEDYSDVEKPLILNTEHKGLTLKITYSTDFLNLKSKEVCRVIKFRTENSPEYKYTVKKIPTAMLDAMRYFKSNQTSKILEVYV